MFDADPKPTTMPGELGPVLKSVTSSGALSVSDFSLLLWFRGNGLSRAAPLANDVFRKG